MLQGEKNAGLGAALLAALVGSKLEDRKQQGRVEAALRIAEQQQQEEAVIAQAMNNLRGTPVSPALSPYPVSGMAYGGGVPVGMDGGMIRLASVADAAGRLMAKEAGFGNVLAAPATRRLLTAGAAPAGRSMFSQMPSLASPATKRMVGAMQQASAAPLKMPPKIPQGTHASMDSIMGPSFRDAAMGVKKTPALVPPKLPVGGGNPSEYVSPLAPLPKGRLQRAEEALQGVGQRAGEAVQGAKQKAMGYLRPAPAAAPAQAVGGAMQQATEAAKPAAEAAKSRLGLKGQLALGGLAVGGLYLGGKAVDAAGRALGDGSGPADANYGTAGGYGGRQLSYGVNQYGYPQLGTPLM